MSATAATPAFAPNPTMPRLVPIELRKATDTRSGRWLLACVTAIAVVAMAISAAVAANVTFASASSNEQRLIGLVLPVVGILLVTTEWSQRTALVTFTLVPRRFRVIAAKMVAGLAIAVTVALAAELLAAVATGIAAHPATTATVSQHTTHALPSRLLRLHSGASSGMWHDLAATVAEGLLYQVLEMLGGMAFGLVFLNSPVAIVLHYIVPLAWGIVTGVITALKGVNDWLNPGTSLDRLLSGAMNSTHWAQVAATVGVWVGLPVVVGLYRLANKEIA